MLLGSLIVEPGRLLIIHEILQYGKRHVGIDRTRTVAHQQCHVHHLAYLAALHDDGYLRTLASAHQMMMHG